MEAVRGDPEDWPALERQRAADGEEVFEQLEGFESSVRVEPVITHADAEPHRDPIQNQGDDQTCPGEGQEGHRRLNMEPEQDGASEQTQLSVAGFRGSRYRTERALSYGGGRGKTGHAAPRNTDFGRYRNGPHAWPL